MYRFSKNELIQRKCALSVQPAESLKSPGDYSAYMLYQQKFDESVINELRDYFDPMPTDCLSPVDFDWHLIFICNGNDAHFDRCSYIIDLTQYWFIEYIFSRRSSNSC